MSKYSFNPYNDIFPILFSTQKTRLQDLLGEDVPIEHIGSTAVPGLGGKGIIDVAIGVSRSQMYLVAQKVAELGWQHDRDSGDENRLFFEGYFANFGDEVRTYHLHIIDIDHPEWEKNLKFRDWLRTHPEDLQRYSDAKKQASQIKGVNKEKYMQAKAPILKEILQKALGNNS